MTAHGISHILTFNDDDFRRFENSAGISVVHPREVPEDMTVSDGYKVSTPRARARGTRLRVGWAAKHGRCYADDRAQLHKGSTPRSRAGGRTGRETRGAATP